MTLIPDWFHDHENIVTLTRWMAENGFDASDVAYAVEKPWKFADEFLQARTPEGPEQ